MLKRFAFAAILLAGCGGSQPGDSPPTLPPDCADLTGAAFAIELLDYDYEPACAIVSRNSSFNLRNSGAAMHTFTIEDRSIDIEVGPGEGFDSAEGLGLEPGVYRITCTLHPEMIGTLEVR